MTFALQTARTTPLNAQKNEAFKDVCRTPLKIVSLQELKETFEAPDALTDGEREACNLATD